MNALTFALFVAAWVPEGPAPKFAITDQGITCEASGYGNWLRTDREYENVRLKFDYNLARWSEAAVVLRAPRVGKPMRTGVPIMLAHDFHEKVTPHVTGALAGVAPPTKWPGASFGQWHKVEITLIERRLHVWIDGVEVQDTLVPEERLFRGYILFPDLGHRYQIRNLEIEPLAAVTSYRDLETVEWSPRPGNTAQWTRRDGLIRGEKGDGILYASPTFLDFDLTLAVKSIGHVNGGVFLRGTPEGYRGFEVQVYSPPDAVYPTGSIYGVKRAQVDVEYEEQWFLMQIRLRGATCKVWLDGRLVAETDQLPAEAQKPGRVGIQMHSTGTAIEVKDVRLRPF